MLLKNKDHFTVVWYFKYISWSCGSRWRLTEDMEFQSKLELPRNMWELSDNHISSALGFPWFMMSLVIATPRWINVVFMVPNYNVIESDYYTLLGNPEDARWLICQTSVYPEIIEYRVYYLYKRTLARCNFLNKCFLSVEDEINLLLK